MHITFWEGLVYSLLQTWLIIYTTKSCKILHSLVLPTSPVLSHNTTTAHSLIPASELCIPHSFSVGCSYPPLSMVNSFISLGCQLRHYFLRGDFLNHSIWRTTPQPSHRLSHYSVSCFLWHLLSCIILLIHFWVFFVDGSIFSAKSNAWYIEGAQKIFIGSMNKVLGIINIENLCPENYMVRSGMLRTNSTAFSKLAWDQCFWVHISGSQSLVCKRGASSSSGNLVERQILGHYPRHTDSQTLLWDSEILFRNLTITSNF